MILSIDGLKRAKNGLKIDLIYISHVGYFRNWFEETI